MDIKDLQVGAEVKVQSGEFAGYYGRIAAIDGDKVTVCHKVEFKGHVIDSKDIIPA